jgi:hypothetical protein
MKIARAEANDNQRLAAFFNAAVLPGDVDLRFERQDFFQPYRLQGEDFATYMLLNEQQEIEATASLVFREGLLGGEKQVIGYATDLRVSNSRRAIMSWAQHFLPILEAEKAQRQCRYVFTTVAQIQRQAYNAFIRPRPARRPLPRYHLFRHFRMISVHGVWPLGFKPMKSILLRAGTLSDYEIIADYLYSRRSRGVLQFTLSPAQALEELRRWPGLSPENFILAFDYHRRLVGVVALWDSDQLQKTFAIQFHGRAKVLHDTLKVMSYLRFAKALPRAGRALHFSYLTHFAADNPDVFYDLLQAAYRRSSHQFVIYPHFEGDLAFTPPRSMLCASMRAGLYCIQEPQQLSPDFLNWSRRADPPEFELPFI